MPGRWSGKFSPKDRHAGGWRPILRIALLSIAMAGGEAAAQSPHEAMRRSLVALVADGIGGEGGAFTGQTVEERATGVLISTDGLILTTYHLIGGLLERSVDGQTVAISANIGEKSATPRFTNVTIMNSMPLLDLLLLKIPPAADPFHAATIGTADALTTSDPLFTSGFPEAANYTVEEGHLNSKDGPRGYLWTVDMPFASGQSGSPIYDKDGTVVGIAKGNDDRAPHQNYMIPIQFADPLIAHLKLAAVEGRLAKLARDIDPLRRHFEWTGRYSEDGREVLLGYTKLMASDLQVRKLAYNVYLEADNFDRWKAFPGLKEIDVEPTGPAEGTILMEDVAQAIDSFESFIRYKPIKEIRIVFVPTLSSGETLPPQTVYVEPRGRSS
jgi:S1-C subfamily serine protease